MTISVVSYGAGVNSTALLIGLLEHGVKPSAILFSDTGGEFPATYEYIDTFSAWLERQGFPPVTKVKNETSLHGTLEQECLTNQTLPSLAFGFKGCSVKWKRQPMDRWVKRWPAAMAEFEHGRRVERLIGIDAGEAHRGKIPDDKWFFYRFPLIEWDWDREECVAAIGRHGLPLPRKSSCTFCPATKKVEVIELAAEHPEAFARAVAIEKSFLNGPHSGGTVKGLGRHWTWEGLVRGKRLETVPEAPAISCECYEGGAA